MKNRLKAHLLKLKLSFERTKKRAGRLLSGINTAISLATVGALIYAFGFRVTLDIDIMRPLAGIAFVMFFIEYTVSTIDNIVSRTRPKRKWWNITFYSLMLLIAVIWLLPDNIMAGSPLLRRIDSLAALLAVVTIESLLKVSAVITHSLNSRISPNWIFVGSFALLIFIGTGLLMLPRATTEPIRLIDALFTSVSAVCVTGLSVVDTAARFTVTGKAIIIILIQLGGIGIMTFTSFFGLMFAGKTSSRNKMFIKDLIDPDNSMNRIFAAMRNILIVTFVIEAVGAWLIYESIGDRSLAGLGHAVFHSISSFCNAGFSTFPGGLHNEALRTNCALLHSISWLIILGGLGFPLIFNTSRWLSYKLRHIFVSVIMKKIDNNSSVHLLSSSSAIVLVVTGLLILSGTVIFLITESGNTLEGMTAWEKYTTAFFMSVSPRTAGYNSFDMNMLRPVTVTWMMLFMWIGASPMSTGGGIKTTTLGIAILNVWNTLRGREYIEIRGRRISSHTINRSYVIIFVSLAVIGFGTILMMVFQPGMTLQDAAFEVTSAFATVGLSLNPALTTAGKLVLIVIMFIGRIGLITLLSCVIPVQQNHLYRYPTENFPIN